MTNGTNNWGVSFSDISWLENALTQHANVGSVSRSRDILFDIDRRTPADHLRILCLRQYVIGLTAVQQALAEFGELQIIYIGGGWCSYTKEAKDFCVERKIGLFVTDELMGALYKREHWAHFKRDEKGNPSYFLGTE